MERILYSFKGGTVDGNEPFGGIVLDAARNVYGTTAYGGVANPGMVYELVAPSPARYIEASPVNTRNTVSLGCATGGENELFRRHRPDCNIVILTQDDARIAREKARSVDGSGSVTKSDLPEMGFQKWGGWQWKTIAAWARRES
jgi:hypothetical protein